MEYLKKELSCTSLKIMRLAWFLGYFLCKYAYIVKVISKSVDKIDLFFQTPYNRHRINQEINEKQKRKFTQGGVFMSDTKEQMKATDSREANESVASRVAALKGKLIVSCQALPHEPLHSSFIMGRMAVAAQEGGAKGIRANTVADIKEIQQNVDLPIIGIIKRDYEGAEVYITPTMQEIDELMEVKPEIIALDATINSRPGGITLDELFKAARAKYPDQLFMADCSTVAEAVHADELGFDFIGSTMVGYTPQSKGDKIEADDFAILREIIAKVKHPVIAEGNVDTPAKLKRVIELGAYCAVVGSIITRPQVITRRFAEVLE